MADAMETNFMSAIRYFGCVFNVYRDKLVLWWSSLRKNFKKTYDSCRLQHRNFVKHRLSASSEARFTASDLLCLLYSHHIVLF